MEFRTPQCFTFTNADVNLSVRWKQWQKEFEIYFAAAELNKKSPETQVAILLHVAGSEAQQVHETFTFGEEEDENNYKVVLEKFRSHCEPQRNVVFERYVFWQRDQRPTETFDSWVTDLRQKVKSCEFNDMEQDILRDKIVFGVNNHSMKERLLREQKLTLDKAMKICRTA